MDINSLMAEFMKRKDTGKGKDDINEMMSTPWTADNLMKIAKDNGIDATPEQANEFLSYLKKVKL